MIIAMTTEKKEKILSLLEQIIGIFLAVIILTIPFPKHIQTTETFCFFIIILAFFMKSVLHSPIEGTRINLPILVFTIFIIVSIFFSVDYSYSLHEFRKYWLKPILLSYFIVNFAVNKRNISYIVWIVLISFLAPIILGMIQYFTKDIIELKSMFGASTEFAQYLDYVIPFTFAVVLYNSPKIPRILPGLILAGAFFCLIFTYTRASWISVLIAVFFLCFIKNKKAVLIVIVLVFLLLVLSPYRVKNRIISIGDKEDYLHRIYLMENTIDQVKKRPFTGYGWGYHNFHNLYPSFISPELKALGMEKSKGWLDLYHAHNYPVEIAFETGLLGLVVFLWLWITIMALTWKNFLKLKDAFLKNVMLGIFTAFIACSIHWLVEIPDAKQLVMLLWTFVGLSMAIINITEKKWEKKTL